MEAPLQHFFAGVRRDIEDHGRLSHYFAQLENDNHLCLFTFPRTEEAVSRVIPRLARQVGARLGILGEVLFAPDRTARLRVVEFTADQLIERSAPIMRIDGSFFVGPPSEPRQIGLTPHTAEIYLALNP
jgi:hypothetical protein